MKTTQLTVLVTGVACLASSHASNVLPSFNVENGELIIPIVETDEARFTVYMTQENDLSFAVTEVDPPASPGSAVYDDSSGELWIPSVIAGNDRVSVRMQRNDAMSFDVMDTSEYRPGLTAHRRLEGSYEGMKRIAKWTPRGGNCAAASSVVTASDTIIELQDSFVFIEQDSSVDGQCDFSGWQRPEGIRGTYSCSNENLGTWTAIDLRMTGESSFFARLAVDVPDRNCSYEVEYIGFR